MPNLDALLESSAHGTLTSIIPPVTTAAWTTMMTGCNPPRHGVFDHRYFDAAAGRMKVNHSGRIRVPTLWHQLAQCRTSVRLSEPARALSSSETRRPDRFRHGRPTPRGRIAGQSRIRRTPQGRGASLLAPLFLEARAAIARGADHQRPTDHRELSGAGRRGPAGRSSRPRLVGPDGPVSEPRPVPASGLAVLECR